MDYEKIEKLKNIITELHNSVEALTTLFPQKKIHFGWQTCWRYW